MLGKRINDKGQADTMLIANKYNPEKEMDLYVLKKEKATLMERRLEACKVHDHIEVRLCDMILDYITNQIVMLELELENENKKVLDKYKNTVKQEHSIYR